MFLSIIIPLYNEEQLIIKVLEKLNNLSLPEFVNNFEIIVVDDGSLDLSLQRVKEYAQGVTYINILSHEVNKGKGAAVKTGVNHAKGDTILVQDADLELSVEDIPLLVNVYNQNNVDLISGSRYIAKENKPELEKVLIRTIINQLYSKIVSIMFSFLVTDLTCGYKMFSKEIYHKLNLTENKFGFETELYIRALKKKYNTCEVPVKYKSRSYDLGKKFKSIDAILLIFLILRLKLTK